MTAADRRPVARNGFGLVLLANAVVGCPAVVPLVIGGLALEYRLTHSDSPTQGDRFLGGTESAGLALLLCFGALMVCMTVLLPLNVWAERACGMSPHRPVYWSAVTAAFLAPLAVWLIRAALGLAES